MTIKLVTVFGGSGFVGRHTVRALARAGHRVRAAVRQPHTAHFLRPMGRVGQIDLVRADVLDAASVDRAVAGSDAVINLVGVLYSKGRQSFNAIHVEAATRIAEAARTHGVTTLAHMSALGASADSGSRYARSKHDGETGVRGAFPGAVIVRPSIVFGPEDAFFNKFADMARFSPALPLIGGGETKFQPVYVGDVAGVLARSVADPLLSGRTFALGGPNVYSFRDLMVFILETIERRRVLLPLPFGLAKIIGFFGGLLPVPPLTMDQVELLKSDNVVTAHSEVETLLDLGVSPQAIESIVPGYLVRFRPRGQFSSTRPA